MIRQWEGVMWLPVGSSSGRPPEDMCQMAMILTEEHTATPLPTGYFRVQCRSDFIKYFFLNILGRNSICRYNGLNVCTVPHAWCAGVGGGGVFVTCLGPEGGTPGMGSVLFSTESPGPFQQVRSQEKVRRLCRKSALRRGPAWRLVLGLPSLQPARKTFLLRISQPCAAHCDSSPNWLESEIHYRMHRKTAVLCKWV